MGKTKKNDTPRPVYWRDFQHIGFGLLLLGVFIVIQWFMHILVIASIETTITEAFIAGVISSFVGVVVCCAFLFARCVEKN